MSEATRLPRIAARIAAWLTPRPPTTARSSERRMEASPPSDTPAGLDGMLELVREDIAAVLEHDPAARHPVEVLLVYPGLHALWLHRGAHALWRRGWFLTPRLVAHANRFLTGIEIHPGARVGRRVFIDHGMGIVVGETATIGDDCLLYKGVVLGGTSLDRAERHPTLGRGVVVGTNACVLGAIQIGDGARVGSGSVVIRDVPARATVVGIPGRVVDTRSQGVREQLDHSDLPDPVANVISALVDELEQLRVEVQALRDNRPRAGRDQEHGDFDDPEKP